MDTNTDPTRSRLIYVDRFAFPGLGPYQRSECRLQVYRLPSGQVVAVATELDDNPGGSITNAAEGLAAAVWITFQPKVLQPPILVDHYSPESYGSTRLAFGPDRWALVRFESTRPPSQLDIDALTQWLENPVDAPWYWRLATNATWMPSSVAEVEALVGESIESITTMS
jgi:hypothetical protein